jgi:tetratricopeptide (TPR) repeat protein
MLTPVLAKADDKDVLLADGENENVHSDRHRFGRDSFPRFNSQDDDLLKYLAYRRKKISRIIPPAKNPRALVEIGDIHLAKQELKLALNAYRNAIRLDPDLLDAYKKLININLQLGKTSEADRYFKQLVKATHDHTDYVRDYMLFRLTFFANVEGEVSRVERSLLSVLKASPAHATRNLLGIVYLFYKNDAKRAQTQFEQVLAEDAKNIDALNNIGICKQRSADHKGALNYYKKAIALDKLYLPAYENIASNYLDQQDIKSALSILEEGLRLKLQYTPIWDHNVGWFMLLVGRFEDAKKWYVKKIAEEPFNNLLFNNLGICYQHLSKTAKAEENYRKAVEIYLGLKQQNSEINDPRALNAFYNLARLLQRKGDFSTLEALSKQLLKIDQDNIAGMYFLGAARVQLKKYISARHYLEEALRHNDNLIEPYIDLSFLLSSITHEYDQAIELLRRAIAKGHNNELISNNLAYALIKNEELSAAEKVLQNKDYKEPNIIATRGLLEFYEGNFARGNKLYRDAIAKLTSEKQRADAEQIWRYEQANFWFKQNNKEKAAKYIKLALSDEKTHIYPSVKLLQHDIANMSSKKNSV